MWFACATWVDMREPWKVLFYHLHSPQGAARKFSWGVSVLHPVHAFMYLTHVLPRWVSGSSWLGRPSPICAWKGMLDKQSLAECMAWSCHPGLQCHLLVGIQKLS